MINRLLSLTALWVLLALSPASHGDAPPYVITTIKPIHSILDGLMDNVCAPELLIDDNDLPYHYTLDPGQQSRIQQADLLIWVGPELEHQLAEPIKQLPRQDRVITLLDNEELKILPSRWKEGARDPFFWLDSRNMIILADELAKLLMRIDPERKERYRENRRRVLERLTELDRQLEYGYRGLKSGIGMAYFDTLQYFEQAYALKIRGVVTESPLTPVSGISLLQNRSKLASGDYSCLLTEAEMETAELPLLTDGISLNIEPLDSLGTTLELGPDLYYQLMKQNTATIKRCLEFEHRPHAQLQQAETPPPAPEIGGKFMLQDHHGKLFTDRDMAGKFQLLYFGYTFCPDVCPTSLVSLSTALKQLGPLADQVQPYFITVDPARDTPEVLSTYVTYFHPSLIGLTGTQSMIDRVTKRYRVKYEKVIDPDRPADQYVIDHSSGLYLMAPDGTFITKFAHGIGPDEIIERLKSIISTS